MKQKKKKKNRLLSNIILAVSLGVFVVAGFQLIRIGKGLSGRKKRVKGDRESCHRRKKR